MRIQKPEEKIVKVVLDPIKIGNIVKPGQIPSPIDQRKTQILMMIEAAIITTTKTMVLVVRAV